MCKCVNVRICKFFSYADFDPYLKNHENISINSLGVRTGSIGVAAFFNDLSRDIKQSVFNC